MSRPFLFLLFATGGPAREIPPARTRASGSYRRERSSPPPGANCLGCNPRARAPAVCTGVSAAHRPQARIDSPGTGPRTCANLLMSTSEASVSPAGSVGPGRSPLGTRTQRRELSCAAMRHVCLGDNPRRARAPAVRTGAAFSRRPRARIDSGGTPPRQKVLCQAFSKESGWNKEGEMGSDYGYRNA